MTVGLSIAATLAALAVALIGDTHLLPTWFTPSRARSNVRFMAADQLPFATPSRSCRRPDERLLWRNADGGPGGWVGSKADPAAVSQASDFLYWKEIPVIRDSHP